MFYCMFYVTCDGSLSDCWSSGRDSPIYSWMYNWDTRFTIPTLTYYTPNIHRRRRRRRDWTVELHRRCIHKFATSSRRLPTDSVDNLDTDCWDSVAVCLREFWSVDVFFNNDVIMLSIVTNRTGNCKLGHDCRRVRSHRRHARHNSTSLLANVFRLVETVAN